MSTVVVGADPVVSQLVRLLRAAGQRNILTVGGRGSRVLGIDRARRTVTVDPYGVLPYTQLVLATGAVPSRLTVPGAGLVGVQRLGSEELASGAELSTAELAAARRVVVLGATVAGLEAASAARDLGADVAVVERSTQLLPGLVTRWTAELLADRHRARGIRLFTGTGVHTVLDDGTGGVRAVRTGDGRFLGADLVLVAEAPRPAVRLAEACGLAVAGGVLVDGGLRTSDPHVSAVGDCAAVVGPGGSSGPAGPDQVRVLADRLSGGAARVAAVPSLVTVQAGVVVGVVGWPTAGDRTVLVGEPGGSGSMIAVRDGVVVGAETVDRPADHRVVLALLRSGARVGPDALADRGVDLRVTVSA